MARFPSPHSAPRPVRRFFTELHRQDRLAGEPPVEELAAALKISPAALDAIFCGPAVPAWRQVEALVRQLDGDVGQFRGFWVAARDAEDEDEEAAPARVEGAAMTWTDYAAGTPVALFGHYRWRGPDRQAHAEEYLRNTLADHVREGTADTPAALRLRHLLSSVLESRGRLAEARTVLESILSTEAAVFGEPSPQTLITRHNLAFVLRAMRAYREAAAQMSAALAIEERALGRDHRDAASTRNELVEVLVVGGDVPGALGLFRELLADELAFPVRNEGRIAYMEGMIRQLEERAGRIGAGRIKHILEESGFGYLTDSNGRDIVFRLVELVRSAISPDDLPPGTEVSFETHQTPYGWIEARNIRVVTGGR